MSDIPLPANTNNSPSAVSAESPDSRSAVLAHAAHEFVFAVVGHVGSGTSTVAESLKAILETPGNEGGYDVVILKAREAIRLWATQTDRQVPEYDKTLDYVTVFQNLGDTMRESTRDNAVVAKRLIGMIRETRAQKVGFSGDKNAPVLPNGQKRAYIIDAIRHPAEAELLRHVYQEAFVLIGVVYEETRRLDRVTTKYRNAGKEDARAFMQRDAKAPVKHGQRVSDAFHLSDFFLDNTTQRFLPNGAPSPHWDINEKLSRLIKIITHSGIVRPEVGETAMQHAHAAAMRSACLSRQVGAALADANGNIIATGTNEVPQAGGGVYGENFSYDENHDYRCAYIRTGSNAYCSNTKEQVTIVDQLIDSIAELKSLDVSRKDKLRRDIRSGRIGDLLEFSRAVHAEMDAVLSAGREGITTLGTRLFVTTFPCHYCARHIVSAGIDEVQFVEPYPKSQALDLHSDAIALEFAGWKPPSKGGTKVLFRPFVGVAPRLYRRAFLKDRELKNSQTGNLSIAEPEWGTPWHLRKASYAELEAALVKEA